MNDPSRRSEFFSEPAKIDLLVETYDDLNNLFGKAQVLFRQGDGISALKLMFHVFLSAAEEIGLHDICDATGLYMNDAMSPEVCVYIKRYWKEFALRFSADRRSWWQREFESWRCQMPID